MTKIVQRIKKSLGWLGKYDEKFEEIKSITSKTKRVYIPELCETLRKARDAGEIDLTDQQIGEKVQWDCENRLGWKELTIYQYLPSWVHDQKSVQHTKKSWEARHAKKVDLAKKIIADLDKVDLPEPPQVTQKQEKYTLVDEETDKKLHKHGLGDFGETGKSIRELRDDILDHASNLFIALTQKQPPIGAEEDLINEYIKPTREDFKSLMFELSQDDRVSIHNRLSQIVEIAEDRLEIIDKLDKK